LATAFPYPKTICPNVSSEKLVTRNDRFHFIGQNSISINNHEINQNNVFEGSVLENEIRRLG